MASKDKQTFTYNRCSKLTHVFFYEIRIINFLFVTKYRNNYKIMASRTLIICLGILSLTCYILAEDSAKKGPKVTHTVSLKI